MSRYNDWCKEYYKDKIEDNKITIEFPGFESLYDVEEQVTDAIIGLLENLNIDGEFQGTVKLTMEYINDENKENSN